MLKPLIISSLFALSLLAAQTACPSNYYEGIAPDIVNPKLTVKSKELCFDGFGVMHSGITKTALWSAEYLDRNRLSAKLPRKDSFHAEERLRSGERAELSDYARSGYDRGHMSPNADMPTLSSQHDSFSLANMVPQDHSNNTGIWSAIEGATRYMAKKDDGVFVITGSLFIGKSLKAIGRNNVLVPTQVYKIVFSPKERKGAVYLCDNTPGNAYKIISIAEIESLAGINFFPKLSKAQKTQLLSLPVPRMRGR